MLQQQKTMPDRDDDNTNSNNKSGDGCCIILMVMLVMMTSASVNTESINVDPVPNRTDDGNERSRGEENNSMEDDGSTSV